MTKCISLFHRNRSKKDGRSRLCAECKTQIARKWAAANKEKKAKHNKKYAAKNKEKIAAYKVKYYEENKDKINAYRKNRKETNTQFRLECALRIRINKVINRGYKVGSAVDDLGCTSTELKAYLESKFEAGMSWENWSQYGWHIDHIKPLSSFNLEDREEFLEACNYTNLQPLWAEDNLKKGSKLEANNGNS
jgi:hypothetical protein